MSATTRGIDSVRAWFVAALAFVAVLVVGSVTFTKRFYYGFVWRYFWGPVHADAIGARCVVRAGGETSAFGTQSACRQAARVAGSIVAEPGYTFVSEAGYVVVLLFMLTGVILLAEILDIGKDRSVFYALLPFVVLGGVLRVVQDAGDAAANAGGETILSYPWNALIISPVIYFVMFVLTLLALLFSIWLSREGIIERYQPTLGVIGTVLVALVLVFLGYLSITTSYVGFYPRMVVLTLLIAFALAGGIYVAIDRFAPEVNAGTRRIGFVVILSQAIDGVANVLASDWYDAIGLPFQYSAKHPVNRVIVDATTTVFPASITDVIGTSWPFPLVKLLLAVGVVWLFDERIFAESHRYALALLVAIVAVGLGPGTRDMLRATLGI